MKKLIGSICLSLFFALATFAQDFIEVSGIIKDYDEKLPMAGCHVYLNNELGTVADHNGEFKLKVPTSMTFMKLNFSFVGYETIERSIDDFSSTPLNIVMNAKTILLDEVVIVADPWIDFRDIITELSLRYNDREEFKKAILAELRKMDSELMFRDEKRSTGSEGR